MEGACCTLQLLVAEKRAGGKLAAGLGARSLEQKMMEIYAKKIYAKNLLDAAEAMSLGKEWPEVSPHREEVPCCR